MKLSLTRRIVPACVLGSAATALLVAPGAASAAVGPAEQCNGAKTIEGSGSSLQTPANEEVWSPAFKTGTNPLACAGTQGTGEKNIVTVKYLKTSSGQGMETWGLGHHGREYATKAFVGTDQPPNKAQEEEIADGQANAGTATGKLLTIPILQAAVAVDFHLPAGCTGTSTEFPGQIALTDTALQALFRGTTKEFKEIAGVTCATKPEEETPITRVVRFDGSGTTAIFKKFLYQIYKKKIVFPNGKHTWKEEAEEGKNTNWPVGTAIVANSETESGGKLAEYVAKNPGTVGYSSVADAAGKESLPGLMGHTNVGPGTETFWAVLQNAGGGKGKHKIPFTYKDPSTLGDSATKGDANCEETNYVEANGNSFPPSSLNEPWNAVTTATSQTNYPLCGFTYILADEKSSELTGFTEPEAQSVFDYMQFVVSNAAATLTESAGGQVLINEGHDFLSLPKSRIITPDVLEIAQKGAAKIGF